MQFILFLAIIHAYRVRSGSLFAEGNPIEPDEAPSPQAQNSCSLYKYVGVNDLSVNDIVVKSSEDETVCIKARFSLAFKVEALLDASEDQPSSPGNETAKGGDDSESGEQQRMLLGYLPLESVISVDNNCPPSERRDGNATQVQVPSNGSSQSDESSKQAPADSEEVEELKMIVKFECGKLAFKFKKEDTFYLASIRGHVHLDSSTKEEFVSEQSMFFTNDLVHHFKFTDLIEVHTTKPTKGFILTANFYNSEIETFRKTKSRSFIRPPDENSQPYRLDEKDKD